MTITANETFQDENYELEAFSRQTKVSFITTNDSPRDDVPSIFLSSNWQLSSVEGTALIL